MKLQILGTGCAKCQTLADRARLAAEDLGLNFELIKVTDIMAITGMGVMSTPALAVNDRVMIQGKLPSQEEISSILKGVAS
jgi:small redox-active disulfide protein 2